MAQAKANELARSNRPSKKRSRRLCTSSSNLLHEVFAEVLEDFALTEAVREGRKTAVVSRDAVLRTLRGKR